jgi:hypothetical protein
MKILHVISLLRHRYIFTICDLVSEASSSWQAMSMIHLL